MFSHELSRLRRCCGLTQKQLGTLCGCSASAIGMMEQGRRCPSAPQYNRLALVFAARGCRLPPRPRQPVLRRALPELLAEEE